MVQRRPQGLHNIIVFAVFMIVNLGIASNKPVADTIKQSSNQRCSDFLR
ncbi:hypothetical protein [Bifidobacterium aquikefiri]